jgi:hypothetical protein
MEVVDMLNLLVWYHVPASQTEEECYLYTCMLRTNIFVQPFRYNKICSCFVMNLI